MPRAVAVHQQAQRTAAIERDRTVEAWPDGEVAQPILREARHLIAIGDATAEIHSQQGVIDGNHGGTGGQGDRSGERQGRGCIRQVIEGGPQAAKRNSVANGLGARGDKVSTIGHRQCARAHRA